MEGQGDMNRYCPNCGVPTRPSTRYCHSCGYDLYAPPGQTGQRSYQPPPPPPPYYYQNYPPPLPRKEGWIAVLLALLIPGVGHIYAGKIAKGIIILIIMPAATVIIAITSYAAVMGGDPSSFNPVPFMGAYLVIYVVLLAFYFWQIYDAYMTIEKYNRSLSQDGKPPW